MSKQDIVPENPGKKVPERSAKKPLSEAAQRALQEAQARSKAQSHQPTPLEINGRGGLEPVRYGDWEVKGLTSDF